MGHISFYADDVILLGDNIDTINKNTATEMIASKEDGVEINLEKTKYMYMYVYIYICVYVYECRSKS
jgi:hypothetical protein